MRKRFLTFLVMSLYMCTAFVWAQEAKHAAPVFQISDEYIKEWLVLGPFFPNDLKKDFLASVGGESNIEPKEGDAVTASDGRTLTWRQYKSETNIIDFRYYAIGNYDHATAYAFCVLQGKSSDDFQFHFGSATAPSYGSTVRRRIETPATAASPSINTSLRHT